MTNDPEIGPRCAQPGERAQLVQLTAVAYSEFTPFVTPANWDLMRTNIARVIETADDDRLLVVAADGRLVGTIVYLPPGPKVYGHVPEEWAVMRVLAVDPAYRRKGIGRMLAEECVARARADEAPAIGLHTAGVMHAARTMYEAMGFTHRRDFTHLDIPFLVYALDL